MKVYYEIQLLTQTESSNCMPTAVSQLLSYYKIQISPAEIQSKISVKYDRYGRPIGTWGQEIATMMCELGLKITIHTFDIEIIDPSWKKLTKEKLLATMQEFKEHGKKTFRGTKLTDITIDSYMEFLQADGILDISICTAKLLKKLLRHGPILALVNFNYLHRTARARYDKTIKNYVDDTIKGKTINHAIVITGFENDTFFVNDPDPNFGGKKTFERDHLIGAICTAQVKCNNYIVSVNT